jgi:hypothetical protein
MLFAVSVWNIYKILMNRKPCSLVEVTDISWKLSILDIVTKQLAGCSKL